MSAVDLPKPAPPEIRFDPLGGHWVTIASERAARPIETASVRALDASIANAADCPFCPGNEHATPPTVWALTDPARPDRWSIRAFANSYPAARELHGGETANSTTLFRTAPGHGVHEVVVERTEHCSTIGDLSIDRWLELLGCFRARARLHASLSGIGYVSIFRNCGFAAGASQLHAHSQILATAEVPPFVVAECLRSNSFIRQTGDCLLDAVVAAEIEAGERIVVANEAATVFCPFASRFPFELWTAPRTGDRFAEADDKTLRGVAQVLRRAVAAIEAVVPEGAYNLYLHDVPVAAEPAGYRWHFELAARSVGIAGFELGGGAFVNPFPPEWAAARLRAALRD